MPHLRLETTPEVAARCDLAALCQDLHAAMVATGVFPLGGIRVKAHVCAAVAVGDMHPENGFVALELSVGAGRSPEALKTAGTALFHAAEVALADELSTPHFMLSLEIREIDPQLSWKRNTVHGRLKAQEDAAKGTAAQ